MRPKSILLLTLALGCGLVASIGISQVLEHRAAPPVDTGETQAIFVALADVAPHEVLTPQVIKLEEWPKSKVPAGAITKLEEVEGKRVKYRLFAGEPIRAERLIGSGEVDGASGQIPKGFRVVSVRVDAVSGGSSLILPGDRVDVLVFISKNQANGINDTCARTVLHDISVFAVDTITNAQRQSDKEEAVITAKTISLLVTPPQAEAVTLATELGSIRLVMRSPEDSGAGDSMGTSVSQLLGTSSGKGDRVAEEPKDPTQNKGLLDILKEMAPPNSPTLASAQTSSNWRMVLMEGSTVREVQFSEDGVVLAEPGTAGAPTATSPEPAESTTQDEPQPEKTE